MRKITYSAKPFDTIEELTLSKFNFEVGDIVDLQGYYEAGDGAHHKRKIESIDDGSGVQLTNGLWANIVHNGEVNVGWFGAKGDGVTDDTVAIQRALNSSDVLIPCGVFFVRDNLKVGLGRKVRGLSKFESIIYFKGAVDFGFTLDKRVQISNLGTKVDKEYVGVLFSISSKKASVNAENSYNIDVRDIRVNRPYATPPNSSKVIEIANEITNGQSQGIRDIRVKDVYAEGTWENFVNIYTEQNSTTSLYQTWVTDVSLTDVWCETPKQFIKTRNRDVSISQNLDPFKLWWCEDIFLTRCGCEGDSKGTGYPDATDVFADIQYARRVSFIDCFPFDYENVDKKTFRLDARYGRVKVSICNSHSSVFLKKHFEIVKTDDMSEFDAFNNCVMNISAGSYNQDSRTDYKIIDSYSSSPEWIKLTEVKWNNVSNITEVYQLAFDYLSSVTTQKGSHGSSSIRIQKVSSDKLSEVPSLFVYHDSVEKPPFEIGTVNTVTSSVIYMKTKERLGYPFFIKSILDNFKNHFRDFLGSLGVAHLKLDTTNKKMTSEPQNIEYSKENLTFYTNDARGSLPNSWYFPVGYMLYDTVNKRPLYKNDGESIWRDINGVHATLTGIEALNTPYHATKMQQEGIYEDFIAYMDEQLEYERQQRELEEQRQEVFEQREDAEQSYEDWLSTQPQLMPFAEPQPSQALLDFKKKYLG